MNKAPLALITGGSSGIGLSMAEQLAMMNYDLLLVSNQSEELEAVQQSLEQKYKVRCHVLMADLSQPGAAQEVFAYSRAQHLEPEVLVNNAGFLIFSEVVQTPEAQLAAILQLHINTPAMMCRLFGEAMKRNRKGYILNVSSISAVMPYPGISLYGPSKTFIRYFTRALRHEMKIYGVGVTCLIPGATQTALYDPHRVNIPLAMKLGVMKKPEFVARRAIRDLFCYKAESIPGWLNKFIVGFLPWVPAGVIQLIYRRSNILEKGNSSLG